MSGQKINGFRVFDDRTGRELCSGQTIGHQKQEIFPRTRAQKLRVEWSKEALPGASLTGAQEFSIGHETLSELGAHLGYETWSEKAG